MRILDANDNEIQQSDVDPELGYLKPDKIFVKHHEAKPAIEQEYHYRVLTFYFEDDTSLTVEDENDPHIIVIDDQQGIFDYKNLPNEEPKQLRGIDLEQVIDVEAEEAEEAYDEYEDIQRYILYTPEQLEEHRQEKEKQEKIGYFMETGPDRLDSTEVTLDDLTILVADIVAV